MKPSFCPSEKDLNMEHDSMSFYAPPPPPPKPGKSLLWYYNKKVVCIYVSPGIQISCTAEWRKGNVVLIYKLEMASPKGRTYQIQLQISNSFVLPDLNLTWEK